MSSNSPYPVPLNAAHKSATKICARFKKRTLRPSKRPSSRKQGKCFAKRFTNFPAERFASCMRVTTLKSGCIWASSCFTSDCSLSGGLAWCVVSCISVTGHVFVSSRLEDAGVESPPKELPTRDVELVKWLSTGVSMLLSGDAWPSPSSCASSLGTRF